MHLPMPMKKPNFNFSEVQKNWLTVITVTVGVVSLFVIGHYSIANNSLNNTIDSDTSQIKKLNAENDKKSKTTPKVEIEKQLPTLYKKMSSMANDIASSQNVLTQITGNHGQIDKDSQAYQAAVYTLDQDIVKDGAYKGVFNTWNTYKGATIKAYPGEYDGTDVYKVLFIIQDNKDSSKAYGYVTGEYHVSDNTFHNFQSYSTDEAAQVNKSAYGDPQGDYSDANIQKSTHAKKGQVKVTTDQNGKAEIVKR